MKYNMINNCSKNKLALLYKSSKQDIEDINRIFLEAIE